MHQIIQQLILDRWNPHRINKKIANHHKLTINQVKYMRSKPAFKAKYDKQLSGASNRSHTEPEQIHCKTLTAQESRGFAGRAAAA